MKEVKQKIKKSNYNNNKFFLKTLIKNNNKIGIKINKSYSSNKNIMRVNKGYKY